MSTTDYTTRIVNYALKTSGFYPLRPMQLWLIDTHFNKANSTMMNVGALYKYDDSIDLEKLAQAINDTVARYDMFRCRLVFHEGTADLCQRFDGEITPVTVEKISDAEFEERKNNLKKPYRLINNPLYRIFLLETLIFITQCLTAFQLQYFLSANLNSVTKAKKLLANLYSTLILFWMK